MAVIEVFLLEQKPIEIEVSEPPELDVHIESELVPVGEHEHYDGDYEITPSVESQEMLTKNKMMDKDVTIKAIPYAEVSNASGGCTISIG